MFEKIVLLHPDDLNIGRSGFIDLVGNDQKRAGIDECGLGQVCIGDDL